MAASKQSAERKRMPTEPFLKSAAILGGCMAVHWVIAAYLNTTQVFRDLSKSVSTFVWSCPSWVCVAPVVVYFLVVMWHLYFRSKEDKKKAEEHGKPGSFINNLLIAWNAALVSFSMLTFAGLTTGIVRLVARHGFKAWVCDGELAWAGDPDVLLYSHLFCLSKFPELLDTAFLVIRGKHVLFLHWYHHISVLLYCWYVTQKRYPATPFACINAFVHSVMYYYYMRTAQEIKPAFAKMVTQIQLIQMAIGMGFTAIFMYWHSQSPSCNGGATIQASGLLETTFGITGAMYFSYFVLFGILYIDRYCKKSKGGHEE